MGEFWASWKGEPVGFGEGANVSHKQEGKDDGKAFGLSICGKMKLPIGRDGEGCMQVEWVWGRLGGAVS